MDVHVLSVRQSTAMEKVKQESMRNGPGAVKGISEDLDQGTNGWRMDYGRLALGHNNEQEYMQDGDKDDVIRVYAEVGPSQDKALQTLGRPLG
jgi:hypothetical protein